MFNISEVVKKKLTRSWSCSTVWMPLRKG